MRRAKHLYEQIASEPNLYWAFAKARRGKRDKRDVEHYAAHLSDNISCLRRQLLAGTVSLGDYHYFWVHDPKDRLISAAPFADRVLHHAIINVCHDTFERFQINHSYATRIGRGQLAAVDAARRGVKRFEWFCKLDVRKYFDSIDHAVLLRLLRRAFADRPLLALLECIVGSYYSQLRGPGRGVPIGNLTSQYFANYYLSFADHYALEHLGARGYVRYMDDIVFFGPTKCSVLAVARGVERFICRELLMELKPAVVARTRQGLPFLGYVLFPPLAGTSCGNKSQLSCTTRLTRHSRNRFVLRLRQADAKLRDGEWGEGEYAYHVRALTAFVAHADTEALRRRWC